MINRFLKSVFQSIHNLGGVLWESTRTGNGYRSRSLQIKKDSDVMNGDCLFHLQDFRGLKDCQGVGIWYEDVWGMIWSTTKFGFHPQKWPLVPPPESQSPPGPPLDRWWFSRANHGIKTAQIWAHIQGSAPANKWVYKPKEVSGVLLRWASEPRAIPGGLLLTFQSLPPYTISAVIRPKTENLLKWYVYLLGDP